MSRITWDLASAFNNAYLLFLNSPVRRSAFTALTGKTTFPQKFCKTRWVENIDPATTFLSVFQQLEAFSKSDGKRKKELKNWLNLKKKQFKNPFSKAKILYL